MSDPGPLPARYTLVAEIGRGAMGRVLRVHDRERGEDVALKLHAPATDGAEARTLFRREYWAHVTLRHPGLVAAHDWGELADGRPYFTLELIEGPALDALIPLGEAQVLALLPRLAGALGALHARGFRHGDLKPENVRLDAAGAPRLLDLGLLAPLGAAAGPARGTPAYMAPELIRGRHPDARADLYALGGLLYHLVAGRPPFAGDGLQALLTAHLDARPTPLRDLVPGLSPGFAAAVERLLEKDPAARFSDVAALLATLGLPHDAAAARLLGAALVGRDALRTELADALRAGGRCHLVGPAGAGKTRLAEELAAETRLSGLPVTVVRPLGPAAGPFEALRPLLAALLAQPGEDRDRLAPALARVVPDLVTAPPAPALEGAQERARFRDAVATLARGRLAGPRLWLVDDIDALDPASRELVATLAGAAGDPDWRWLTTADEDAGPPGARRYELVALTRAALDELIGQLLGQVPPAQVAEQAAVLAAGVPGRVEILLAHWIDRGALVRGPAGWERGDAPLDCPAALGAAGLPEGLDAEARALGGVAALLGTSGSLALLEAAAGLRGERFFAALQALVAAGLIELGESGYRLVRPCLSDVLVAEVGAEAAREAHARAATWLAAEGPAGLGSELARARHLLAAGDVEAGAAAALAAARAALAVFAAEPAERLARAALDAGAGEPTASGLRFALVDALRFQGRTAEALTLCEGELAPALASPADAEAVRALVTCGVLLMLRTRYPDAAATLARAAALADARDVPDQALRARFFAARVAYFEGRGAEARAALEDTVARARALLAHRPEDARVRANLAGALSLLGYMVAERDEAAGLAMLEEAIAINRAHGDMIKQQEDLTNLGNVHLAAGRPAAAHAVFAESLALCERIGSENETLIARLNLGLAALELGRAGEAVASARAAQEAAERLGRRFPWAYAAAVAGLALVQRGEPAQGEAAIAAGLAEARAIANAYAELAARAYMAEALFELGRWEDAERELEAARALAAARGDHEHDARLRTLRLAIGVRLGRADAAAELEAALAGGEERRGFARDARWLAEWRTADGDHAGATTLAEAALAAAAEAGLGRLEAELHELAGRAALAAGRHAPAATHFEAGLALAERLDQRAIAALCRAGLGRLRPGLGLAARAAREAEAMLAGLDSRAREAWARAPERRALLAPPADGGADVAMVERLVETTEALARARTPGEVVRIGLSALMALSGAERGFCLLTDGFAVTDTLVLGDGADAAFSTSVANRVMWGGEPLFFADVGADEALAAQASVQALELRALVGLPLVDGDAVVGALIADSRGIGPAWSGGQIATARALAAAVSLAWAAARERERLAAETARAERLASVALALVGASDFAEAARRAAGEALAVTGAERALVLAGERPVAIAGEGGGEPSRSVVAWVYANGRAIDLVDVEADEGFGQAASVMALGLRTIAAAPVIADGACVGVLYVDSRRMLELGDDELALLGGIGHALGAAWPRQA